MLIFMKGRDCTPQNATTFEFVSRQYIEGSPDITFSYRVLFSDGEPLTFSETITLTDSQWATKLPIDFKEALLEDLHLVLGISYYKLFCPPAFELNSIFLTPDQVTFWNTLYTKGLGEFLYRNNLSASIVPSFSAHDVSVRIATSLPTKARSLLVGVGGGKDSIVALELLKKYDRTGFVVATGKENTIAQNVTDIAGIGLQSMSRTLDPKLIAGVAGSYNGHVPISAVYAFLGVLEAALGGHAYIVVSNEYSSNFGNLLHEGTEVNHQWSKSTEFETLFQNYVRSQLTPSITYFSLMRPFYELRIVKLFTQLGTQYFEVFSSCNRNFAHVHEGGTSRWCGECPKCAFAFLMLSAFLSKEAVLHIFKKDLFEDKTLLPLFRDILGWGTLKPFDCVGTFDESRVALSMAREQWSDSYIVSELAPALTDTVLSKEVFKAQKAATIPSQFRLLGMDSVLILGYGKEGQASESYIKNRFPELTIGIADQKDGGDYLEEQHNYDVVVKTPVIPSEKVVGQSVTATQLFFNEVGREHIIGVTGSKGKSTTATLIYLMLKKAGKAVRLVGNIGVPALESILETPAKKDEIFVFELSSYQLEDLDVSPHVAVVTSLFPEHLDHHGSLEAYYKAKQTVTAFQTDADIFVYSPEFPLLVKWAEQSQAIKVPLSPLPFEIVNTSLKGAHNQSNAVLACSVAQLYEVTMQDVQATVDSFEGLPHRLMHVGTYTGIEFYDDSISTTPESAIAGLRALGNVDTIILGGVDRGYDFSELEKELRIQGVRNLILFPESGTHMLTSEEGFNVLHTRDMAEAVQFAYTHTEKGKSCLLSPAAPSYNLFKNFEERGALFSKQVIE